MIIKTEIKIFTESYIEKLSRDVKSTQNVDNYYSESFPCDERHPKGNSNVYLDLNVKLNPAQSAEADLESSIKLYEALEINETQASDPRLWTYLSHVTFWSYMRKRWALENVRQNDSPIGRVNDRYILTTPGLESLSRHGIARLWWYAHLTIDTNRNDKYELTKILLKRAEISVGILERVVGTNYNTRTAILEFLKENEEILINENLTRSLLKAFNLFGGIKILPILEVPELKEILNRIRPAA
jgi:hypothetical protein